MTRLPNRESPQLRVPLVVRPFERRDAPQLWSLMRALAEYEGYIDEFAVQESDVIEHGLGRNARFQAFVAERAPAATIVGMAVCYLLPWTYDLRPTLVLKELYVSPEERGCSVGTRLMDEVVSTANALNASSVRWTVMNGNTTAESFYRTVGGAPDQKWHNWRMQLPAAR